MINIQDEVLEFIHRRFPIDSHFLDGNCYYFAQCLLLRFVDGEVLYDVIYGHFVFKYKNKYYDWSGQIEPQGYLVSWNKFDEYDSLQKQTIIRDCIM